MVVKLTGIINGSTVVFERNSGDVWEATIPKNLNGQYVVELYAYDEAGNIGYAAKYIITIDLEALCVKFEPYPYYTRPYLSNYYCILKNESRCLKYEHEN